jgi:HK97 family phage prohead protease
MTVRHEIKNVRAAFKAVQDAPNGTFEAIVSVFGNVDLGGDRVMPGAFAKSLADWESSGDRIPVIWSHDWDDPMSHIGYVEKAEERPEGLFVQARLDVDNNTKAAYIARLLKERRVREFSFGYFATGYQDVDDLEYGRVRELTEIDLFEVGPTLLGMNPDTVLLEAASRFHPREKATADEVREGVFVQWDSSGGTARGRIEHVMTEGTLGVPGSSFTLNATPENPALLIRIFQRDDDGWEETETLVGHRAETVTVIDPLPAPSTDSLKNLDAEAKYESPRWMRANARKGLAWYEEGLAGDGVVERTIREARQMADGFVSEAKATRMAAWFARHMVDLDADAADPDHPDYPSPGVVAHALWGGGSRRESERAMRWAEERSAAQQSATKDLTETIDVVEEVSRDEPPTIDTERLAMLLARPRHTEE